MRWSCISRIDEKEFVRFFVAVTLKLGLLFQWKTPLLVLSVSAVKHWGSFHEPETDRLLVSQSVGSTFASLGSNTALYMLASFHCDSVHKFIDKYIVWIGTHIMLVLYLIIMWALREHGDNINTLPQLFANLCLDAKKKSVSLCYWYSCMTEETQRKLEKCKCTECVYNNLMFHIFHYHGLILCIKNVFFCKIMQYTFVFSSQKLDFFPINY